MSLKEIAKRLFIDKNNVQEQILKTSIFDNEVLPIQVDEVSAKILSLLVAVHRPVSVLEIGTHFGYSTYAIAKNLGNDAKFISLDISESTQRLAAANLATAGLSDRVTLVCSDVIEYLEKFPDERFDFVFIDGAKVEYWDYLVHIVKRISDGGLVVADDVFLDGDFSAEPGTYQEMEDSIKKFLVFLHKADFIDTTLIPTEMGMTVSVFRTRPSRVDITAG